MLSFLCLISVLVVVYANHQGHVQVVKSKDAVTFKFKDITGKDVEEKFTGINDNKMVILGTMLLYPEFCTNLHQKYHS